jgi:hypothetical protein
MRQGKAGNLTTNAQALRLHGQKGLAAKMQGASLKLLGIYLMFDLSLPGGYALQLLQDSPKLTRHARYRIRGYRSCVEPEEVVALLLDTR